MPPAIDRNIKDPTYEKIITAALQHFEVSEDVLKTSLKHQVSYMRWCIFTLARQNTRLSYESMAYRFGKPGCSAQRAVLNLQAQMETEKYIKKDIQKISEIAGISSTLGEILPRST